MIKRSVTIAGVAALVLVLAGCARHNWYGPCLHPFEGPVPPDDQIGMITESDLAIASIDGIEYSQMGAWVGEERGRIWSSRYAHWDLLPGEHTVEVAGRVWENDDGRVVVWPWDALLSREGWDSMEPHAGVVCDSPPSCAIKGSWQLTFSVEPEHKYHIRFETEEEGLQSTGPITYELGGRTTVFTGGLSPIRVSPYVLDVATGERVGTCTPIQDSELATTREPLDTSD